jgi:hypothetical protein
MAQTKMNNLGPEGEEVLAKLTEIVERAKAEMMTWDNYVPAEDSLQTYASARKSVYATDKSLGTTDRLAFGGCCRQTFGVRKIAVTRGVRDCLRYLSEVITEILKAPSLAEAQEIDLRMLDLAGIQIKGSHPTQISGEISTTNIAKLASLCLQRLAALSTARYPKGNDRRADGGKLRPTHRKEKILAKLPDDWGDLAWQLACECVEKSGVDYLPAFGVMIAGGSRPKELTGKVIISRMGENICVAHFSAKGRRDDPPLPRMNGILAETPVGQYLMAMLGDRDRIAIIPLPPERRQAYVMWLRRIGAKLRALIKARDDIDFGIDLGEISSTTYRHGFAANAKAGLPPDRVPHAMGHRSALTQQKYAKSTRSKGRYSPTICSAIGEIRNLDKLGRPERIATERGAKAAKVIKPVATVVDGGALGLDELIDVTIGSKN